MMKKIYIEITNNCNLNCAFCLNTKREKAFIDVEDFETIIKKVKNYTKLVCLHVKGEPLLHPKLKEIFKASKFSKECSISLGTDNPIKVAFKLVTGAGELSYLLAPRLEES